MFEMPPSAQEQKSPKGKNKHRMPQEQIQSIRNNQEIIGFSQLNLLFNDLFFACLQGFNNCFPPQYPGFANTLSFSPFQCRLKQNPIQLMFTFSFLGFAPAFPPPFSQRIKEPFFFSTLPISFLPFMCVPVSISEFLSLIVFSIIPSMPSSLAYPKQCIYKPPHCCCFSSHSVPVVSNNIKTA